MFPLPPEYKDALMGDVAQVDVYITLGKEIDPTSADDITSVDATLLPMSNTEQIIDANYDITVNMATFEADGIKTSADAGNLAPPLAPTAYPPEVGIWSEDISDADGNIDFTFSISLGSTHASGFTIYTYQQNILEATIKYYVGNEVRRTAPLVASAGHVQDSKGSEYDRIVVNITKLDQPYTHVKVAEIEFGASETYGKANLVGTVSLIQEWDPTMRTIPLHELDFSLMNVLGEFDEDNPDGMFDKIKQNYPAEISFSIVTNEGKKYTVKGGRYIISSRKATDTTLDVTALDARSTLQQNVSRLEMTTTVSFGDMFTDLFGELHIPFAVDDDLFQLFPDQDYTFEKDGQDLLTVMKYLEQYYGIWLIPERSGNIHVTKTVPGDEYGLIDTSMVNTYPQPDTIKLYNYITVTYGTGDAKEKYIRDLRVSTSQTKSQFSINNPLVRTLEKATEIANRVVASLYTSKVETDWRGDPAIDVTDYIDLEGKWTEGNPTRYRLLYNQLSYDGGLSAVTRSYR